MNESKLLVVVCLVLFGALSLVRARPAVGQSAEGAMDSSGTEDPVVQQLVQDALKQNLSLEQTRTELKKRRAALAQTRGQSLPSLDLTARYTRAQGGRTIDFPAGDLVNPAYRALEDVTQGRSFPTVENQEIELMRSREQRTTLQLRQPLFRPEIRHGAQAREHEVQAQKASVDARRRTLARDVTVAYYQYRKAQARVDILKATRSLVRENRRTNERLLAAEKTTKDAVRRAEAEVLAVRQKLQDAHTSVAQARRRLNVLRNRPADAPIPAPQTEIEDRTKQRLAVVQRQLGRPLSGSEPLADASTHAASVQGAPDVSSPSATAESGGAGDLVGGRPELRRLDAAVQAAEAQRRAAQTEFLPTVSLGVDAGIQGETYGFSGDKPFARASLTLEWNLFDGFSDHRRVQRRRLETQRLRTRREHVKQQLTLKAREALDEVRVAQQSLRTAEARVRAAQESFRLTRRRYDADRANQATLIDARTALTEAKLNRNVTRYDLLIHLAELEHAAGIGTLVPQE